MAAEYSKSKTFPGAYRIDETLLARIVELIAAYTEADCDITFSLVDGSELKSKDLSHIIDDYGFSSSVIKGVKIRSSVYRPSYKSAFVGVGDNILDDKIRIDIAGERKEATGLLNEIENLLHAAEAAYSFIDKIWNFKIKAALAIAAGIIVIFYASKHNTIADKDMMAAYIWVAFATFMIITALESVKNYFFPKIILDFGINRQITARRSKLFNGIFWSVLVAAVVSYFVNIYTK